MKVCLDAGHGGHDSGATFKGLLEKNVNLQVVRAMKDELERFGHEIVLTRDSDFFVPLIERAKIANASACKCFVSVHCNADPDPDLLGMSEARGEEIWIYPGSVDGYDLAFEMQKGMYQILPSEPFRGIKFSSGLAVLRYTRMTAALVEIGFIDCSATSESFCDPQTIERIAHALNIGILSWGAKREREDALKNPVLV